MLPVGVRHRRLGHFLQERSEVSQTGDERRRLSVQHGYVFAGAAKPDCPAQILQRYTAPVEIGGELFVRRRDDLLDAWKRLRETAISFGDKRIYASHHSIMFSRKSCYFFVRSKKSFLELCVFLGREVNAPQVRRVDSASKTKIVHFIRITHRDEVESPVTDWLREAYDFSEGAGVKPSLRSKRASRPRTKPKVSRRA